MDASRPVPLVASVLFLVGCSGLLGLDEFGEAAGGAGSTSAQSTGSVSGTSTGAGPVGSDASAGVGGDPGTSTAGGGGTGSSTGIGGAGGAPTSTSGAGGEGGAAAGCENQEQDGTETGIDCGGDCPPCEPSCPSGTHLCAPPVVGWTGPLALVDDAIGCGAPFPTTEITVRSELLVPAGSCDCACGAPSVTCPTSVTYEGWEQSSTCNDNSDGGSGFAPNLCHQRTRMSESLRLQPSSSTCGDGAVSPSLPVPTWGTELTACTGFAEGGTCEGEALCVPSPIVPFEEAKICVIHAGETSCPAGYPNLRPFHEAFQDDRACATTCSCTGGGSTCRATATLYSGSDCTGSLGGLPLTSGNSNTCALYDPRDSVRVGNITVLDPGTCSPAATPVTGSVEATVPVTVCCL